MNQERTLRAVEGHLSRANRAIREARDILAGNDTEPRQEAPRRFRPVSPARDARFYPPNPEFMKPSRMAARGRHGSRRRR
jgi:hypothetical protein